MDRSSEPNIASVDKLPNGILVTFEEGKLAIFSAALLYVMLPHAQQVEDDLQPESAE
jgi:hypothetical protein